MSTSERRAALREKLVDLAQARIARQGLGAVKARDLAREAECSVGAIYNVFGTLDDLVLAVNGETFKALGTHVVAAIPKAGAPVDRLIAMSEAYLDFAGLHPRLWRALFEVEMSTDGAVPEWYLGALDQLLTLIDAPIHEIFPDLDEAEVRVRTRALFSAIHGIVLLGIEKRISSVDEDRLSDMIKFILRSVAT